MDLNSLYHGAKKVASCVGFPPEKVCLVYDGSSSRVGIEFAGSGVFIAIKDGFLVVLIEPGTACWLQPLEQMTRTYVNPRMALVAAGMILMGESLSSGELQDILQRNQHDQVFPSASEGFAAGEE